MKFIKENICSLITCLIEVIVGILLLINPVGFTSGIIITIGIILLLCGIIQIIRYFLTETVTAAIGQRLARGLMCAVAGLFCIFRYNWFIITFPVLTILYGIAVLITGFYKVQITVDRLRLKKGHCGWMTVSAVLSLALAAIILWNPFTSSVFLWHFTAISLIVEAVFDIVTIIMSMRKGKNDHRSEQANNNQTNAAHS